MKNELLKKIDEYYCSYFEANQAWGNYFGGAFLNTELKKILKIKRDIENIDEYIPVK